MITKLLMAAILAMGLIYIGFLVPNLLRYRAELHAEPGKNWQLALITFTIQFFATFGISDFAMSTPTYRGMRLVDDARLPGTLVTAAGVPMTAISLLYISSVEIHPTTLALCIIAQALGSILGVRFVSRLSGEVIRIAMGVAISVSAAVMLIKMVGFGAGGGERLGFSAATLCWMLPVVFLLGAVNMIGFGVKAPLMALYLSMGLTPLAVLPLVMGGCCAGTLNGAVQYVRSGRYQRRIAAVSTIFGTAGVFLGAQFVEHMNVTALQWIMLGVMLYTAYTMLRKK
ncbi:MAG: sulfite exporter TauE/SafE family protein [Clostridiaceae bacterium]|nr:sulfite exporter TauE/SafE family protein [Clostridiaceae bacterium]